MIRLTGDDALMWVRVFEMMCKVNRWLWSDEFGFCNVFGIRSTNSRAGVWDDECMVLFNDPDQGWTVLRFCITTDPGPHFMVHPVHGRGAALIVHGHQYMYRVGYHKAGRSPGYKACNQHGKVLVYRDNDKNRIQKFDVTTIMCGNFGINHHHGGGDFNPGETFKGKSAGCQVWCRESEFNDHYLQAVIRHEALHGRGYPYAVVLQEVVDLFCEFYTMKQALVVKDTPAFVWEFFS